MGSAPTKETKKQQPPSKSTTTSPLPHGAVPMSQLMAREAEKDNQALVLRDVVWVRAN